MLLTIFDEYPNIIYAAGHEDNRQYVKRDGLHHIISGRGDHAHIAPKGNIADFATEQGGISIINFYENGDAWIEFWTDAGKLEFRYKMFNQQSMDYT